MRRIVGIRFVRSFCAEAAEQREEAPAAEGGKEEQEQALDHHKQIQKQEGECFGCEQFAFCGVGRLDERQLRGVDEEAEDVVNALGKKQNDVDARDRHNRSMHCTYAPVILLFCKRQFVVSCGKFVRAFSAHCGLVERAATHDVT